MLHFNELTEAQRPATVKSIYVYEAPVRLWHWINGLAIVALAVTGYLIAHPLPSVTGEASDRYVMGWIRLIHFGAAHVFAVAFLLRVYWAIVGNDYARQLFIVPVWNGQWWREMWHEIKWYAFIEKYPLKYGGHNPLAQFMMFFVFVFGTIFMILTGFALYSEGTGLGSWEDRMFGWIIPLFGQSQDVHSFHHLGMWVMACFVLVHVYAAIREDIMSRQSLISTMVSGYRMFKD